MRNILLLILILFSGLSRADTYPATITYTYGTKTFTSYQSACTYSDTQTHYVTVSYQWLNSMWACVNAQGGLNAYVSKNTSCPYGGTLSGTSCINAPACPTGQTRNATTGACESPPPPSRTCLVSEYDDGTACVPIPDCNKTNPNVLGSYFDVVSKSCKPNSDVVVCANQPDGSPTYYCQAIDDCKPSSFICSNSDKMVEEENATRQSRLEEAKQKADESASNAEYAAKMAEEAALQKQAEAQIAANDEFQARVHAQDFNNELTPAQREQAKKDFAESAARSLEAETQARNAASAAKAAKTAAGASRTASDSAASQTRPGSAAADSYTAYARNADTSGYLNNATNGNAPAVDTNGLASESTSKDIARNTQAILEALTGSGASGGSAPPQSGEAGAVMGTYEARGKNNNPDLGKWYEPTTDTYQSVIQSNVDLIKDSPIMSFGKDIFSVSIPSGSCPSWTFPAVMGMPVVTVAPLCADFMDSLWNLVSAVIQLCAVFMAFKIAQAGLS